MMLNHQLGQNDAGDFDQLSLAGVDFGHDYTQNYGILPNYLEGDNSMGNYNQLGHMPAGLGSHYQQVGTVPSGLMGDYNQMGHSQYSQLGQLTAPVNIPVVNMQVPMYAAILGGLAVAYFANKQFKFVKLPF